MFTERHSGYSRRDGPTEATGTSAHEEATEGEQIVRSSSNSPQLYAPKWFGGIFQLTENEITTKSTFFLMILFRILILNISFAVLHPQPTRPVRPMNRDIDMMDVDMERRPARDRGSERHYTIDRGSVLVSSLSRSLADIPRASARPFAPERASLSDRMRGRLDQRQDPPCSVLVSNLHPNVSENDINVSLVLLF